MLPVSHQAVAFAGPAVPLFAGPTQGTRGSHGFFAFQQPHPSQRWSSGLAAGPATKASQSRRRGPGAKSMSLQMASQTPGGQEALTGINKQVATSLVLGEVVVGAVAVGLALLTGFNPFSNFYIDDTGAIFGALAALPIFAISVYLEKSGVKFFQEIDQDTKLFVLQIFGIKRNPLLVVPVSAVLALSAGFFEELLFRGVLQQALTCYTDAIPALFISSFLFGLAHNPVPGASALLETSYGLTFGIMYMISGGNLFVPIVCHFVYDLLTFNEVHFRATGSLDELVAQQKQQGGQAQGLQAGRQPRVAPIRSGFRGPQPSMGTRVQSIMREYGLSEEFVDACRAIFVRADLDKNGVIDQREMRLGIRTFGKFASDKEANLIMDQADTNEDGFISFDEFLVLIASKALQLKSPLQAKVGRR